MSGRQTEYQENGMDKSEYQRLLTVGVKNTISSAYGFYSDEERDIVCSYVVVAREACASLDKKMQKDILPSLNKLEKKLGFPLTKINDEE